jgi:hypothetical protein
MQKAQDTGMDARPDKQRAHLNDAAKMAFARQNWCVLALVQNCTPAAAFEPLEDIMVQCAKWNHWEEITLSVAEHDDDQIWSHRVTLFRYWLVLAEQMFTSPASFLTLAQCLQRLIMRIARSIDGRHCFNTAALEIMLRQLLKWIVASAPGEETTKLWFQFLDMDEIRSSAQPGTYMFPRRIFAIALERVFDPERPYFGSEAKALQFLQTLNGVQPQFADTHSTRSVARRQLSACVFGDITLRLQAFSIVGPLLEGQLSGTLERGAVISIAQIVDSASTHIAKLCAFAIALNEIPGCVRSLSCMPAFGGWSPVDENPSLGFKLEYCHLEIVDVTLRPHHSYFANFALAEQREHAEQVLFVLQERLLDWANRFKVDNAFTVRLVGDLTDSTATKVTPQPPPTMPEYHTCLTAAVDRNIKGAS